ncbi:MAG: hypothetical protein CM1200mP41_19500 [Gammaproteobacteria bacterium]|nr:MAG: hypothetical protein CM1200mP41_19500 [Gammaproteobacteria bacterium]
MSAWTETKTRDEVIKLCSIGDVPCGPVNSIADIFDEPQYWERDTLVRVKDDRIGDLAVQGVYQNFQQIQDVLITWTRTGCTQRTDLSRLAWT